MRRHHSFTAQPAPYKKRKRSPGAKNLQSSPAKKQLPLPLHMPLNNRFDIAKFCERMERHLGDQEGEAKLFWQALSFAVTAHEGQKRKSGEAYVSHPCRVAQILIEELRVKNPEILAAAVLHDTIEDVPDVTHEVIGEIFGRNVEAIVDGCTKINDFFGDRRTFYNMVHRKIFSGAASRISVMLIKLADRLHNMRTMGAMPKHKRQKIAEETLTVYAPLAKVMGLFNMKRELFNRALLYKFPRQSNKLMAAIRQQAGGKEAIHVREKLQEEMDKAWLTCTIEIRPRGIPAYYDSKENTLVRKIDFPLQIIIVVNDTQACYRALGILNQTFPPIPRTIRDFIANPKPTGYQSLHAKTNIKGKNYLFKIRTEEMLRAARSGIIKDWLTNKLDPSGFEKEIREMFNILGTDESLPYREVIAASGKKEIYTYTPKGDRICLPHQSIVLDFAFKVHTEVGHHCIHAYVGQKKVMTDHVLQDGDQVKLISSDKPVRLDPRIQPLCQSPRARAEMARMFRLRRENLAREIGKSIIRQELKKYGMSLDVLQKEELTDLLAYFDLENIEEMFQSLGEGQLRLKELVYEIKNGLYAGRPALHPPVGALNRISLTNLDPVCVKFSRCCNPVPTETGLLGFLDERGVSVHRKNCAKIKTLKFQREDVVELRWQPKKSGVEKSQTLHAMNCGRNRVMMLTAVAPEEMKLTEILSLSTSRQKKSDWEIKFEVDTLHGLKNILNHFTKAKIDYEFLFEQ